MRRSGENAAALGCVILAACSFPSDYEGTRFRCERTDECPPGFTCVAGSCESGARGPDGGAGSVADGGKPDGGRDDGGVEDAAPACASAIGFEDDFSSGVAWEVTGGPDCEIRFEQNEARMNSQFSRCFARTVDRYELDGRIWIEAVKPGGGSPRPAFGLFFGDRSLLSMRTSRGLELVELSADGENQTSLKTIQFAASLHRFWGFRLDSLDRKIHWETSSDGLDWTERAVYETRTPTEDDCVRFELDVFGVGFGTVVAFDNVNLPNSADP